MPGQRLFAHQHYLEFLRSEMEMMKQADPDWSLSRWARDMGLDSVVGLHLIMKGSRRPGAKSIPSFVKFFGLNSRQEEYFRLLVKKDLMARDAAAVSQINTKLKVLVGEINAKVVEDVEFKVIADWYHFAIQQMLTRGPLEANPEKIKSLLRYDVSTAQVTEALENLCNLGVIELKEGFYHCLENSIRTTTDVPSEALKTHHEQMIQNGLQAIRQVPVSERQIQGRTLVVAKEDLPKAAKMIQEFGDAFGVEIDQPAGTRVYQLNVQFFPLSQELS